jgi:hypothetical protein
MVVTVEAQQFPVAAIERIVVVVVVPVMHRQLAQFFALEFAGASAADVGEEFQSLLPVSGLTLLFFLAHLRDEPVIFFGIRIGHKTSLKN